MLYNYSVTPLKEDHFEERCADIVHLHQSGVITMPLFPMTLVPEGNPVWDKASGMARLFARYRDALAPQGVPCGILVQASLGHGYAIEPNPFQRYENLTDGEPVWVCCPEDERFIQHFCGVLRTLAEQRPAAIMLDDDFRMSVRPGKGCVCPLHLRAFNRRAGTRFTKNALRKHLLAAPAGETHLLLFEQIQCDSLVKAAAAFRAAIDAVDPSIQGINCTSGHYCDSVIYTNPIFAGKGHPTIVRVPNGVYAPFSVREFSECMRQAAICKARMTRHGIEILLAETDTIPFNRYAKSAAYLHAHYTASILEGLKGAKHWLSRTSAFEPGSGKAYRAILAKHVRFYERLSRLADEVQWLGVNSAFIEEEHYDYRAERGSRWHENAWATKVLERMGLPFRFSDHFEGATLLEGSLVPDLTDAQIAQIFKGSVFADAESAAALIRRGYGNLLGVAVSELTARISGECFNAETGACCTAQKNAKKLTCTDPAAEVLSFNFVSDHNQMKPVSPAVTALRRKEGLSVVFCGSPNALFKYTEGFAFLNESRKEQLTALFSAAGALPVYCPGDEEICLRAGRLKNGALLAAAYPLGVDCTDSLRLCLAAAPHAIQLLHSDGRFRALKYAQHGSTFEIRTPVRPMTPIILKIN